MKFLLDVCCSSRSLMEMLEQLGHDVLSAVDIDPCAPDDVLLKRALDDGRILVTEDKDFGELVFVRQMQHSTIVRFVQLQVEEQLEAMRELLEGHTEDLEGSAVIVVSKGRIRIRQRPE